MGDRTAGFLGKEPLFPDFGMTPCSGMLCARQGDGDNIIEYLLNDILGLLLIKFHMVQ